MSCKPVAKENEPRWCVGCQRWHTDKEFNGLMAESCREYHIKQDRLKEHQRRIKEIEDARKGVVV